MNYHNGLGSFIYQRNNIFKFYVSCLKSELQNTGVAPALIIAFAEETQVKDGTCFFSDVLAFNS